MTTEINTNDVVNIDEVEYKTGDFVNVSGYGPPGHTRVIRVDKIEQPHLTFLCEYENGKALFKVNSVYVIGMASEEDIENEFTFRKSIQLSSIFSQQEQSITLTYAWGSINEINTLSPKLPTLRYSHLHIVEVDGKYALALQKDEYWHDQSMAINLNIRYVDYINILIRHNGEPAFYLMNYPRNDFRHSTYTYFDDYNDSMNCVQYLKSLMVPPYPFA